MTIGRIPRLIPAPRSRRTASPPRPLAAPASRRPRPARIGCRPNRRSPHPAPPSNRRPRRPSRRPRRPRARPTRRPSQPASLRILKRHPRLRKATLKDPRRHSGNSRLAHPPGRQDRRQSAKTIIRSNSRKRLRHNPRRKRREAGRKRPVVGASPPQSKSNEQPAPPPRPRAIRVPRLRNRLAGQSRPNHPPLGPRTPAVLCQNSRSRIPSCPASRRLKTSGTRTAK